MVESLVGLVVFGDYVEVWVGVSLRILVLEQRIIVRFEII